MLLLTQVMNLKKSVIMGIVSVISILGMTFVFSAKTFAVTPNSEQQIKDLAGTIKKEGDGFTGKLGSTTINFQPDPANNVLSSAKKYTATNLDCNGTRATLGYNPVMGGASAQYSLTASYLDNGSCKSVNTKINANSDGQPNGIASSTEDEEPADSCVTTNSGPLGWIMCPVIDLASTFSQGVFTHFIQPFLEDVPVTTNPNDGAYIAWKQFRLIGNIVLVGTMIAVVYAQVRGGKN